MGQKVNPKSCRTPSIFEWGSNWYADGKEYTKRLIEDLRIRSVLEKSNNKKFDLAINRIVIDRANETPTVTVQTAKPRVLIGKGGDGLSAIKKKIKKLTGKDVNFNVKDVKKPELEASLVGQGIAYQLQRRASFRKVAKAAIQGVMKNGALGVKIIISGRINGAEMARTESLREGSVPLHTFRANIDYACVEAHTIYGVLGVKVWIYRK